MCHRINVWEDMEKELKDQIENHQYYNQAVLPQLNRNKEKKKVTVEYVEQCNCVKKCAQSLTTTIV